MRVPIYFVKPNATLQAPPIAAARYERRLLAVACKRLLGFLRRFAAVQPEGTAQSFRVASAPTLGAVPWKTRELAETSGAPPINLLKLLIYTVRILLIAFLILLNSFFH